MSLEERQKHHTAVRNILEIYGSSSPEAVIKSTMLSEDKSKIVFEERRKLLSTIRERKQLLIPIMVDGILPGAFAYDYLKKKDMLLDVVFVGHTRKPTYEEKYKPGMVYMTDWDRQTLRKHSKSHILVVDDAIDNGTTLTEVAKFINDMGVNEFEFICLRDVSGKYGKPTLNMPVAPLQN